ATAVTESSWPTSLRNSFPVAASQRRTVWSEQPVRASLPSVETARPGLKSTSAVNRWSCRPLTASQSRTEPSSPPERTFRPPDANDTAETVPWCEALNSVSCPVARSNPANPDRELPSRLLPSDENVTACSVTGSRLRICLPVLTSQTRKVSSSPHETIRLPSGGKSTDRTFPSWPPKT